MSVCIFFGVILLFLLIIALIGEIKDVLYNPYSNIFVDSYSGKDLQDNLSAPEITEKTKDCLSYKERVVEWRRTYIISLTVSAIIVLILSQTQSKSRIGGWCLFFLITLTVFCLIYMMNSFYMFHYDGLFLKEAIRNLNSLQKLHLS
jgi:hypothetical protein